MAYLDRLRLAANEIRLPWPYQLQFAYVNRAVRPKYFWRRHFLLKNMDATILLAHPVDLQVRQHSPEPASADEQRQRTREREAPDSLKSTHGGSRLCQPASDYRAAPRRNEAGSLIHRPHLRPHRRATTRSVQRRARRVSSPRPATRAVRGLTFSAPLATGLSPARRSPTTSGLRIRMDRSSRWRDPAKGAGSAVARFASV